MQQGFWETDNGKFLKAVGVAGGGFVVLTGLMVKLSRGSSVPIQAATAPKAYAQSVPSAARPAPKQPALSAHHQRHSTDRMTDEGVLSLLAAQGVKCSLEDSPLADGRARRTGPLPGGTTMIELVGDPHRLQSISLTSIYPAAGGDRARLSGAYIGLFLRSYAPRTLDWACRKLASMNDHPGGMEAQRRSHGRQVTVWAQPGQETVSTGITIARRG